MPLGLFQTVFIEIGKNLLQEALTAIAKSAYENAQIQERLEYSKKSSQSVKYYFKVYPDGQIVKVPA